MAVKIALEVTDEISYISMIRQIARLFLAHHRVSPQDIDDIVTALGEMCSNVVCHAHGASYHVGIEQQDNCVIFEVADQGPGFDLAAIPHVGEPRPGIDGELRMGGFGLFLVESLTHEVDILPSTSGTTVRAKKFYRPMSGLNSSES